MKRIRIALVTSVVLLTAVGVLFLQLRNVSASESGQNPMDRAHDRETLHKMVAASSATTHLAIRRFGGTPCNCTRRSKGQTWVAEDPASARKPRSRSV